MNNGRHIYSDNVYSFCPSFWTLTRFTLELFLETCSGCQFLCFSTGDEEECDRPGL